MRASARKIANFVSGCSTKDIYGYLQAMGFVAKDKFGLYGLGIYERKLHDWIK